MMKSSIDEFAVILDDPDHVFSPGEYVHGKVIFKAKKTVKIPQLWLECRGEAYVSWPENSGTYTRYRHCVEEYYHRESCIYHQETSSQDVCNDYAFSFRFTIPNQDLPPSYESVHGYIRYSISAKIKKKNRKTKYKTEKTCFIIGNYEEYDEGQLEDIKRTEQKLRNGKDETATLGKQCYPVGMVNLSAYTDKILYQDGDVIKTEIHVENKQEIEKIYLSLVRVTKYSDLHGHSTCYADNIVSVDKALTQEPPKDLDMRIAIPQAVYPTMQLGCQCISVNYHIKVLLRPKNKRLKELNIKIPIIILSSSTTPKQTPTTTTTTTPTATTPTAKSSDITNGHTSFSKGTLGALFCVIGRPVGSTEYLLNNGPSVRSISNEDEVSGISNMSRTWSSVSLV